MGTKIYAESKIELTPAIARHYDRIINSISFGRYDTFINQAIKDMEIKTGDQILDLGCGTGKNAKLMTDYIGEDGGITGIDLSPVMQKQFLARHSGDRRISFIQQRVDVPFELDKQFDTVFISFVIHGFPHKVREELIRNAHNHLKKGGKLVILDFSEFNLKDMPVHHRFIFKKVECKYAFDYIERDWKRILRNFGFDHFSEKMYIRKYARLLVAEKYRLQKNQFFPLFY